MSKSRKKKMHHYVHDAYLENWRLPSRLYAFNLKTKTCFEPTGRNSAGGENWFNNFRFDPRVVGLLNFTFKDRALNEKNSDIYKLLLSLINFMFSHEYEHKTENFIEDFYGKFESKIGVALKNIFQNEIQVIDSDPEIFDTLVIFYCVQLKRTRKMRNLLSTHVQKIYADDVPLDAIQKDEYIKMLLLIESFAMAMDILHKGAEIRLIYARQGEKFLICDAPAVISSPKIERLEDLVGFMPLSPRLLMEIRNVGVARKIRIYEDMTNDEVVAINRRLISNAERTVYFSSNNHREKYTNLMMSY